MDYSIDLLEKELKQLSKEYNQKGSLRGNPTTDQKTIIYRTRLKDTMTDLEEAIKILKEFNLKELPGSVA